MTKPCGTVPGGSSGAAFRISLWVLLAARFGCVLYLNLPGHLSVDSLMSLAEWRSGVFESGQPFFIAVVFGLLSTAFGGTDVLVVISTLLFGAAVWLFVSRARSPSE